MNITVQDYSKMVKKTSTNSKAVTNCLKAFLVGGTICTLGEGLKQLYIFANFDVKIASNLTSITLILLGAIITALGFYDNIAKHAGAGTLVPITGFSNAVTSVAIEFKSEGWILGVGSKMFAIAGPVIVYGIASSTLYGIILWILMKFCVKI